MDSNLKRDGAGTRRAFVLDGLRLLAAGAVLLLSGVMGIRSIRAGGNGRACDETAACHGCPESGRCTLREDSAPPESESASASLTR